MTFYAYLRMMKSIKESVVPSFSSSFCYKNDKFLKSDNKCKILKTSFLPFLSTGLCNKRKKVAFCLHFGEREAKHTKIKI